MRPIHDVHHPVFFFKKIHFAKMQEAGVSLASKFILQIYKRFKRCNHRKGNRVWILRPLPLLAPIEKNRPLIKGTVKKKTKKQFTDDTLHFYIWKLSKTCQYRVMI